MFPKELLSRFSDPILLGIGGMGLVYRATEKGSGKFVAIKISRAVEDAWESPLVAEGNTLRNLSHVRIPKFFDAGIVSASNVPFLVEEYVEGETLEQYLSPLSTLAKIDSPDLMNKVRILRQLAQAMLYLHSRNVVYADLSAKNVIVDKFGNIKLIDFDLAFDAKSPTAAALARLKSVGTSAYMSPERILNKESLDHRDDIYAFGILAYQTFCGALPFDSATDAGARIKHLIVEMPMISQKFGLPVGLSTLIGICTEKTPENRYDSFEDICTDLIRIERRLSERRSIIDWILSPIISFLARSHGSQ